MPREINTFERKNGDKNIKKCQDHTILPDKSDFLAFTQINTIRVHMVHRPRKARVAPGIPLAPVAGKVGGLRGID